MSELTTEYSEETGNIHVPEKIRGFCIPYPGKAEPGDPGVKVHENQRAQSWETQSRETGRLHHQVAGII